MTASCCAVIKTAGYGPACRCAGSPVNRVMLRKQLPVTAAAVHLLRYAVTAYVMMKASEQMQDSWQVKPFGAG